MADTSSRKSIWKVRLTSEMSWPTLQVLMFSVVYEMCHHIPSPLENRVFPTLVVRAKTGVDSFVVAQIPVELSQVAESMYSSGRHRTHGGTSQKKEKVVQGQYTSIERIKPSHEHGKIIWEMATASVRAQHANICRKAPLMLPRMLEDHCRTSCRTWEFQAPLLRMSAFS